jgi:hypothetical protein
VKAAIRMKSRQDPQVGKLRSVAMLIVPKNQTLQTIKIGGYNQFVPTFQIKN